MSQLICRSCRERWDARRAPLCPRCEAARLHSAPGLIRDKHHPGAPRAPGIDYRSFLARSVVEDPLRYLTTATADGSWFYSGFHATWNLVVTEPLGRAPGMGLHAGEATPDHTLDSLLVADAFGSPHLFAIDRVDVRRNVDDGAWVALTSCAVGDCANLAVPGETVCAAHGTRPRADRI